MIGVEIRRALPAEYSEIARLNAANLIINLSAEERAEGFLSAQFSDEQLAALADDLGITVAIAEGRVAGFLCAFRRQFKTGSPVIAKMLASYDRLLFEGKPLSVFESYIYGPVCIARDYRRLGILRRLYETQKTDLAGLFELGVAFVSKTNTHSLNAHIAGLEMREAGDFELNGNGYVALAFRLPPH